VWDVSGFYTNDPTSHYQAEGTAQERWAVYLRLDRYDIMINLQSMQIQWKGNNEQGFEKVAGVITSAIAGPDLPSDGLEYRIIARHSNKAISLPEYSRNDGVTIYQSGSMQEFQRFKFFRNPANAYVSIVRADMWKALSVSGNLSNDGTTIQQIDFDGNSDAQKFFLIPVDGEYFRIVTIQGKVLDVNGGAAATADNTPITLWTWHGGGNQQFKLEEISGYGGASFRRGPEE
jgi:hypothetical protein